MAGKEAAKRARAKGEEGSDVEDESPTKAMRSSFEALWAEQMGQMVSDLSTALEPNIKTLLTAHAVQVDKHVKALDAKVEEYAKVSNEKLDDLSMRIEKLEMERTQNDAKHKKEWERIDKPLGSSSIPKSTSAANPTSDFTREIDASIFKVNCENLVAKSAVLLSLSEWLTEASMEAGKEYVLEGNELGKFFTIQFSGDYDTAVKRCTKARQLLRGNDGIWKRFECLDPQKKTTQLYVGFDKNNKLLRTEYLSKRLLKAIESVTGEDKGKFQLQKKEGKITLEWQSLAKIEVVSKEKADIKWVQSTVDKYKIDKDAILSAYNLSTGSDAGVLWSS